MKVILTACPSSVGIDPVSLLLSIIKTILITIKNNVYKYIQSSLNSPSSKNINFEFASSEGIELVNLFPSIKSEQMFSLNFKS